MTTVGTRTRRQKNVLGRMGAKYAGRIVVTRYATPKTYVLSSHPVAGNGGGKTPTGLRNTLNLMNKFVGLVSSPGQQFSLVYQIKTSLSSSYLETQIRSILRANYR